MAFLSRSSLCRSSSTNVLSLVLATPSRSSVGLVFGTTRGRLASAAVATTTRRMASSASTRNSNSDNVMSSRLMRSNKKIRFTPTCDLYDEFLDEARVPYNVPEWRCLGGTSHFCGPAVTVKCFEDNSRIKELLQQPAADAVMNDDRYDTAITNPPVLVVDAGGPDSRCAVLGDMIAGEAVQNGWAGLVVHGRVRDVATLERLDSLGIMASGGPTPRKSVRRGEGQAQLTVQIGNVDCSPGDIVFCDRDGVLILRPDQLKDKHYE